MFQMTLTFVDAAETQHYISAMYDMQFRNGITWQDIKDLSIMEDKLIEAYVKEGGTFEHE